MKIKNNNNNKKLVPFLFLIGLAAKAHSVAVLPHKAGAKPSELFGCFANKKWLTQAIFQAAHQGEPGWKPQMRH